MKKSLKTLVFVILAIAVLFSFTACKNNVSKEGLWENAVYTKDTTFGNGKTSVQVEVKAGDDSVTFTLKTDKTVLGDALCEFDLIAGDETQYGLYVKKVNGIVADYDIDCSYWAFFKDGEMMMVGVDGATIADGEHYELVYTK